MAGLVFKYLLNQGGLAEQEKRNQEKSALIYGAIDSSDLFYCPVPEGDRSPMNVVFRHKDHDEAIEKDFIARAKDAGFDGLKGHRSVGGIRASIYNACPRESVVALVDFMKDFRSKNG